MKASTAEAAMAICQVVSRHERRVRFVDLNRDEIVRVPLKTRFTGLDALWLPRAILTADLIVSMPKVKTHHWAGVTLSLKNMFGVIPGATWNAADRHCTNSNSF
jgi:uncharacterized protein (DUF362 family)